MICLLYKVLDVNVSGLNKFKKRRFHETVNLLTGESDAHPDLIKVSTECFNSELNKIYC